MLARKIDNFVFRFAIWRQRGYHIWFRLLVNMIQS